ncbi:MAG: endonuclease/exonuclease/phosphatase family protein [Candidatus Marinimicrobia bacterium]|nr:endonuclease/exonuclease/phosphatase family protein [Candidatus Neomarinimicrobiota bacterium]
MKTQFKMLIICSILLVGCDPLVTIFEDSEDPINYTAKTIAVPATADTITVMTWNIRYGATQLPWFGDSCGDRVMLSEDEVFDGLEKLLARINTINPDIIFLQEVDVESKRTQYIDQVQWLLDHTAFNFGAYASMWKAQVIPSDGLGRMDNGNAILSRWPITDAERIQLPLRGDMDALTKYFYLRRNVIKAKIEIPGTDNVYAVGIHSSAFATDDTKQKQINKYIEILDDINSSGGVFISGGDLNAIPPTATKTDFCLEDACNDEDDYHVGDDNHREGSYFTPEITWLQELYDKYSPASSLTAYNQNESQYFTHTPNLNGAWDRKLDYLWTNTNWVPGSAITLQEAVEASDHVAVIARWEVPQ